LNATAEPQHAFRSGWLHDVELNRPMSLALHDDRG
jgi:hypothetical protein